MLFFCQVGVDTDGFGTTPYDQSPQPLNHIQRSTQKGLLSKKNFPDPTYIHDRGMQGFGWPDLIRIVTN